MVPTVERGLRVFTFCSIAMAGGIPSILSTAGFCILPRNCLANDERLSAKRRCPSAKRVSNAREDFPLPLSPLITTSLPRGIFSDMFLRLFTLAPFMYMYSFSAILFLTGSQNRLNLPYFPQCRCYSIQMGIVSNRYSNLCHKLCLVARLAPFRD